MQMQVVIQVIVTAISLNFMVFNYECNWKIVPTCNLQLKNSKSLHSSLMFTWSFDRRFK